MLQLQDLVKLGPIGLGSKGNREESEPSWAQGLFVMLRGNDALFTDFLSNVNVSRRLPL